MAIRMDAANELLYYTTGVSKPYTMMAWVQMVVNRSADSYLFQHILNGGGSSHMLFDSARKLAVRDSAANRATGTTIINVGEWHHVAFTLGANMTGYLDGVQEAQRTAETYTPDEMDFGGLSSFFNGRMAAIKCWAAELSIDEIKHEMRTIRPQRFANLSTWYPMIAQTLADNYVDRSGNARTLTLYGGTLTVEDGPPVGCGAPITWPQPPQSNISEVGSATNAAASGTDVSVTHGLTIQPGDVLVAVVSCNNYVTIDDNNGSYPFAEDIDENFSSGARYAIYSRVAGASEPATYHWTLGATNAWAVHLRVFRGVDPAKWDVAPSGATRTTSGVDGLTATSASIDSHAGNLGIIIALSDASAGLTFSDQTNGYGNELERGGTDWPLATYTKVLPSEGATGTVSLTLSATNDWTVQHVALKAAVGPPLVWYDHEGVQPWSSIWRPGRV